MTKFNNNTDPKIIPKLSSDHAVAGKNPNIQNGVYRPPKLNKVNSASFQKQTMKKVTPPPYFKPASTEMVHEQVYEKEKKPLPVKAVQVPDTTRDVTLQDFSKSVIPPSVGINPVDELFQGATTTVAPIELPKEEMPKKNKMSDEKRKRIMRYVMIGILLELVVIAIIFVVKSVESKKVLECSSTNYNSYYEANITITKKYYYQYGKIQKLLETTTYAFDTSEAYEEFKKLYANTPYQAIEGRIVTSGIDDNKKTYEEKMTFQYKKLRKNKKNTSNDKSEINILTDNVDDQIHLMDYGYEDMKNFHTADMTCR